MYVCVAVFKCRNNAFVEGSFILFFFLDILLILQEKVMKIKVGSGEKHPVSNAYQP